MRRVLVDTNALLAALVFPGGVPAQVFLQVVAEEQLVLTPGILDEARNVVARKWPDRRSDLEQLFASVDYELLPGGTTSGIAIRDAKDQPILDAAVAEAVDVILTGDKDFLAFDIERPKIVNPRGYLELLG
ncbi:MAG: putative toxin-antitoxin system toxin component, PIN family [Propionicimonas sp.]|nr:putative toxin-antitoxin system toxin component, PIN family [Propionicimonas sp.]